jgi:hypothetical protein
LRPARQSLSIPNQVSGSKSATLCSIHFRVPTSGQPTAFSIQRSLAPLPSGAGCVADAFGDRGSGSCGAPATPATFPLLSGALDETGRVNLLAVAGTGSGQPLAYGWAPGIAVTPGGTSTAAISAWVAPVNRTLHVTHVPASRFFLRVGVGANGIFYPDFASFISNIPGGATVDLPLKVAPAGVGERPVFMVMTTEPPATRGLIVTDSTNVDLDDRLPAFTGFTSRLIPIAFPA